MGWEEIISKITSLVEENKRLRLENDSLRDDIDNLKYELKLLKLREDDLK